MALGRLGSKMGLGRLGSKMALGWLGSKMGLDRGSKMALGRLGSKIALGRLDTRQNGSESENTRHFGCEVLLGTLALGRTRQFTYTPNSLLVRWNLPENYQRKGIIAEVKDETNITAAIDTQLHVFVRILQCKHLTTFQAVGNAVCGVNTNC